MLTGPRAHLSCDGDGGDHCGTAEQAAHHGGLRMRGAPGPAIRVRRIALGRLRRCRHVSEHGGEIGGRESNHFASGNYGDHRIERAILTVEHDDIVVLEEGSSQLRSVRWSASVEFSAHVADALPNWRRFDFAQDVGAEIGEGGREQLRFVFDRTSSARWPTTIRRRRCKRWQQRQ